MSSQTNILIILLIFSSTEIQLTFSDIPLKSIEKLFQIIHKGVGTSQLWASERERNEKTSGFVTALVPTGDKDCCFTITVSRKDMMRGVRQLGLTELLNI